MRRNKRQPVKILNGIDANEFRKLQQSEMNLGTTIGFVFPDKLIFLTTQRLSLGEYVVVNDEIDGKIRPVLAKIEDLVFSDFQTATRAATTPATIIDALVHDFEGSFSSKMFLVAQTQVLGIVGDDYSLIPLRTPVRPGLRIESASADILQKTLSPKSQSPIKLGTLSRRPDVEVFFDADKISQHCLITGMTGTGKTRLAMQIALEAKRLGLAVIVMDHHGEWENFEKLSGVKYVDSFSQKVDFLSLGFEDVSDLIQANTLEREILETIFSSRDQKFGSPRKIMQELSSFDDSRRLPIKSLYRKLARLEEAGVFGSPGVRVMDNIAPSRMLIFKSAGAAENARFILRHLLRQLLWSRIRDRSVSPGRVLLVLDDCGEYLFNDWEGRIDETISQARKLEVGFCLGLQALWQIPSEILALIGSFFVFRPTSERDIVSLGIGEYFSPELMRRLVQQEVAVSGVSFRLPLLVNVVKVDI